MRVAGVRVGRLRPSQAVQAVRTAFARPLAVVVDRSRLVLDPSRFASAYIETAVARARIAKAGTNVPLVVTVHGAPVRAWVAAVHKRYRRDAVDATLTLRDGQPFITEDRVGRTLEREAADRARDHRAALQLAPAGARAHGRRRADDLRRRLRRA